MLSAFVYIFQFSAGIFQRTFCLLVFKMIADCAGRNCCKVFLRCATMELVLVDELTLTAIKSNKTVKHLLLRKQIEK